jgi:thiosulfate/3-mercaptopyruvate sulfurtransferase
LLTVRCLSGLVCIWAAASACAAADFAYVRTVPLDPGLVVLDTRPLADCSARSLPGARCLPSEEFLGPANRLPNARDLLWLFGTIGLSGSEDVLVAGQSAQDRDFVAGLLYAAGQRSVRVLIEPIGRLLGSSTTPGRARSMVREAVFVAPMRDDLLVLREELRAMRRPLLLDGRTQEEYWGEKTRAARGGHLPGAISLPALQLRAALHPAAPRPVLPMGEVVAYAHDALEGFAYLTLLRAGHGVAAKLYAEGWAEWAADGSLPADAVSYPERSQPIATSVQTPSIAGTWTQAVVLAVALAVTVFVLGWSWGVRRSRSAIIAPNPAGRTE